MTGFRKDRTIYVMMHVPIKVRKRFLAILGKGAISLMGSALMNCISYTILSVKDSHVFHFQPSFGFMTGVFVLDSGIAYPMIVGSTAPVLGWIYWGIAFLIYFFDSVPRLGSG